MHKRFHQAARVAVVISICVCAALGAHAIKGPDHHERFEDLVIYDPPSRMGRLGDDPETTEGYDAEREHWRGFKSLTGGDWMVRIDRRSGTPMLVSGSGIPWFAKGEPVTVEAMAAKARQFMSQHGLIMRVDLDELVLREEGSGAWDADHHLVQFDREIDGIPVQGQMLRFVISHGNLVMFGADRWGPSPRTPRDQVMSDAETARQYLFDYMELTDSDEVDYPEEPKLKWITMPTQGETNRAYVGPVGQGVRWAPVWEFSVQVNEHHETWVGKVDAITGEIRAFYDGTHYAQAKAGVFPRSSDGNCPDGCEQPDYPLPWLNITVDGNVQTTSDMGSFTCSAGNATTSLVGPFVRIDDACGAVSEGVACDNDLDLGLHAGNNCSVAAGASAGNTQASRSCYYNLNRVMEKGRYWLPTRTWLDSTLECNTNVNSTCNATYGGSNLNMYRAGGGCGNTGTIGGVVHHEYGHGLDQNDGGGSDNTSEAYADVVAIFQERISCVGRGFYDNGTCGGYGDTCLSCSGIRDHDWADRTANTPATPSNFTQPRCSSGGGPCGRSVHCESYVISESIFDLATRDLPAMGIDADSSWQLAERLWYVSRLGSGGAIYNCNLPNSDGCGAGNWFMEMMAADDDDGNMANGTPHGAAIFAAFDRHDIACGLPTDPSNQNNSSCPTIDAPALTVDASSGAVSLDWNEVPGASFYRVLRTENECDYSQNVIAEVAAPASEYFDDDLANGFTYSYRVQAVGSNSACESPVSTCVQAAPQAFDGSIKFGAPQYACTGPVEIRVTDANVGSSTLDVTVFSDSETAPEIVTLTETPAGSSEFTGTIQGTTAPSANGDGLLQIRHFDGLTAEYIDSDDGEGGSGISKIALATTDCVDLVRTSLTLDDTVGGNGDGILDPGEWVDLPLELQNTGDDIAQNVSVQVEVTSGNAEVRVANSALPDMPGSSSASTSAGSHMQIRIRPGQLCTDPIGLRFSYLADNESVVQDDTIDTGTETTLDLDNFEASTSWAHVAAESTASTGDWVVGDPDGTASQPEDDVTEDPGALCLFTQPNPGGLGTDDVDNGTVVARSGEFDLSAFPDARVSLYRWFSNRDTGEDVEDFYRLEVRESSTSPDVLLEELDFNQSAAAWTEVTFRLGDFVTDLSSVSLKVSAADGPATGNLIEAAIDEVRFWDPTCTTYDPVPNSVITLRVNRVGSDLDVNWTRPVLDPDHGESARYRVYRSQSVQNGFSEIQVINDNTSENLSFLDAGAGDPAPGFYAYLVISENDSGASEPAPAP